MVTKSNLSKCNKYKHRACAGSNTVQIAYAISQCSDAPEHACSLARAFISLAHAKMGVHTAYLSVITQTRLSMHAVLPEPSLLSHIHTMGEYMASFVSQCSNKP